MFLCVSVVFMWCISLFVEWIYIFSFHLYNSLQVPPFFALQFILCFHSLCGTQITPFVIFYFLSFSRSLLLFLWLFRNFIIVMMENGTLCLWKLCVFLLSVCARARVKRKSSHMDFSLLFFRRTQHTRKEENCIQNLTFNSTASFPVFFLWFATSMHFLRCSQLV